MKETPIDDRWLGHCNCCAKLCRPAFCRCVFRRQTCQIAKADARPAYDLRIIARGLLYLLDVFWQRRTCHQQRVRLSCGLSWPHCCFRFRAPADPADHQDQQIAEHYFNCRFHFSPLRQEPDCRSGRDRYRRCRCPSLHRFAVEGRIPVGHDDRPAQRLRPLFAGCRSIRRRHIPDCHHNGALCRAVWDSPYRYNRAPGRPYACDRNGVDRQDCRIPHRRGLYRLLDV